MEKVAELTSHHTNTAAASPHSHGIDSKPQLRLADSCKSAARLMSSEEL